MDEHIVAYVNVKFDNWLNILAGFISFNLFDGGWEKEGNFILLGHL